MLPDQLDFAAFEGTSFCVRNRSGTKQCRTTFCNDIQFQSKAVQMNKEGADGSLCGISVSAAVNTVLHLVSVMRLYLISFSELQYGYADFRAF